MPWLWPGGGRVEATVSDVILVVLERPKAELGMASSFAGHGFRQGVACPGYALAMAWRRSGGGDRVGCDPGRARAPQGRARDGLQLRWPRFPSGGSMPWLCPGYGLAEVGWRRPCRM